MTAVQRTEADGVPVFWSDLGRPTLRATLSFRIGQADEPLARRGLVHLIEHVALDGRWPVYLEVNGETGPITTTFLFDGPPELVADALGLVTAAIGRLEPARLEREIAILAAEADVRVESRRAASPLVHRFGLVGPGVLASSEFGLHRVDAGQVLAFAREAFCRGNATLALTGPVPPGLRLELPLGDVRRPLPAWESFVSPPCAVEGREGQVVLTCLTQDAPATDYVDRLMGSRHRTVCTEDLGTVTHHTFAPTSGDIRLEAAAMMADLRALASDGPAPDLLAEHRTGLALAVRGRGIEVFEPQRAAYCELLGRPYLDADELLAEHARVTPADVADAARACAETAMLVVPDSAAVPERLRFFYGTPRDAPLVGNCHWFNPVDTEAANLRLQGHLLEYNGPDGLLVFDLTSLVLYAIRADGRVLVRPDGCQLTIAASQWSNFISVISEVDAIVDRDVVWRQV